MSKIASKTKITLWAVIGDKERLDLDLCDFSAGQIATLERFVRHPEDKVQITIAPEQKKLQIAPLVSPVRLVSVALRSGGQKLKFAEFHSPDERATALKRLSAAETPVLLTIETLQEGLAFDDAAKEDPALAQSGPEDAEAVVGPCETRKVPLPKNSGAKVEVSVGKDKDGRWRGLCRVTIPHNEFASRWTGPVGARPEALHAARSVIAAWLDTQEQYKRRAAVMTKVNDAVDAWIEEPV